MQGFAGGKVTIRQRINGLKSRMIGHALAREIDDHIIVITLWIKAR